MVIYTRAYQLSDIHIKGPRYEEYQDVFDSTIEQIKALGTKGAITILCGDIFHHKKWISPRDLQTACSLLRGLAAITPVVIIPGNHDMNLNNAEQMDLITPIMNEVRDLDNITYYKSSGVYRMGNINFCHFSLHDKQIPTPPVKKDPREVNIALLHEEINGATAGTHGHKFSGYRMSVKMLEPFDIAMAGHIHDAQFIRPTIAYCGSLLQQDPGEKDSKGFISWDLDAPREYNGVFHRVFNNSMYLKVRIVNNEVHTNIDNAARTPTYAHKIYVDYRASSMDVVNKTVQLYEKKYNRKIDRLTCSDVVTTLPNVQEMLNSDTNQEALIYEFLGKQGHNNEVMNKVVEMHRVYLADRGLKERSSNNKWTLEHMSWKNLFCYKTGNAIDFTKLNGITGVIARNKSGKSSILDILVFGLFNKLIRGNRNSIVNNKSSGGYKITIRLRLNDDVYTITRWEKLKGKGFITFYRNDTNLTKEAIDTTYNEIREVVGSYENFMTTLISMQDDSFNLVRAGRVDRKSRLNKLFGVDLLDGIEQSVKEDIKEMKTILKARSPPEKTELQLQTLLDDADDAYRKTTVSLEYSQDVQDKEQSVLETLYTRLQKTTYTEEYLKEELTATTRALAEITISDEDAALAAKHNIDDLNKRIIPVGETPALSREQIETALVTINKRMDELRNKPVVKYNVTELNNHKNKFLTHIDDIMKRYHHNVAPCDITLEEATTRADELKTEDTIAAVNESLAQLDKQDADATTALGKLREMIETTTAAISNTEAQQLDKCQSVVDAELTKSKYTYNSSCGSCSKIKASLDNDLQVAETALEEQRKLADAETQANAERTASITKLQNNITLVSARVEKTAVMRAETLARKAAIEAYAAACETMESARKVEYNKMLEEKVNEIKESISEIDEKLNAANESSKTLIDFAEFERKKNRADGFLKTHEHIEENNRITEIIRAVSNYNEAVEQREQLRARESMLRTEFTIVKENAVLAADIAARKAIVDEQKALIADLQTQRNTHYASREQLTAQLKYCIQFNKDNADILERLPTLDLYQKALNSKTGIPNMLVCKTVSALCDATNNLLSEICDFKIKFSEDSNLDLFLVQDGLDVPIELSSGFQKFIVNILMRIALSELADVTLSTFFIIDEGFGCLDKTNLENIQELFVKMAPQFACVFIISHVEELQSMLNNPLFIDVGETHSTLCNDTAHAERIQDELREEAKKKEENVAIMDDNIEDAGVFEVHGNEAKCIPCDKIMRLSSKKRHAATKTHIANLAKIL